jgi:hypothetical protein
VKLLSEKIVSLNISAFFCDSVVTSAPVEVVARQRKYYTAARSGISGCAIGAFRVLSSLTQVFKQCVTNGF